ncbi:MAG: hypothetical protein LAN83_00050 [Acidobacteriia bacterium]|nr:hypothetical protein [Terriglobia bacterium]
MKDKLLTSFLFAAVLLTLTSTAIASTTWYVNGVSGSNSNDCKSSTTACKTIGHAISLAASGDSIKVAAATYTENLTISISLKILGSGAKTTILDGGSAGRVIYVPSATAQVTLSGVTITHGISSGGGGGAGIFNSGALTLVASTLNGNVAGTFCQSCSLGGGGISNAVGAHLTIKSSTVSGNEVELVGCSPSCYTKGGGIYNLGTLALSNSTVSGNVLFRGFPEGGGIYNGGVATISNSTIAGNTGGYGGGIFGTATLQNSIVANTPGNCLGGTMNSLGYNLSSDATCNFTSPGDLNNTDPLLGPLQYNGGPTQTMALPSGSPAVDAGNPSGCTDGLGHLLKADQRGKPRPGTGDTGNCDMGAYERQSD